jgi:hypothetical protein
MGNSYDFGVKYCRMRSIIVYVDARLGRDIPSSEYPKLGSLMSWFAFMQCMPSSDEIIISTHSR